MSGGNEFSKPYFLPHSLNRQIAISQPSGSGLGAESGNDFLHELSGWNGLEMPCASRFWVPLARGDIPPQGTGREGVQPGQTIRQKDFPAKNRLKKGLLSILSILTDYLFEKQQVMMKEYKRTSRHLSQATRDKISAALRGRRKPKDVCKRISKGLRKYWSSVEEV